MSLRAELHILPEPFIVDGYREVVWTVYEADTASPFPQFQAGFGRVAELGGEAPQTGATYRASDETFGPTPPTVEGLMPWKDCAWDPNAGAWVARPSDGG